jgi:hypothetical protein
MGREDLHKRFWWGDLRYIGHLEDPEQDGRIILKWNFMKWDEAWTTSIWLRKGTSVGLLCMR